MKFSISSINPEKQKSTCIVSAIFESCLFSKTTERLDKVSNGYIRGQLHYRELDGKPKQVLLLHNVPNILSEYILLIGCGKEDELDEYRYKKIIRKITTLLNDFGLKETVCCLVELCVKERNTYWKVRQAVEIVQEALYHFYQLKTNNKNRLFCSLKEMIFNIPPVHHELTLSENAIQHGLAISSGIKAAKDLGNMPPNICNAAYLASQAKNLSNDFSETLSTCIIDAKKMKELGMNAYLAVGNSSKNESLMSIIKYTGNPTKHSSPIIFVGKGMTFDSGGISIKPSEKMAEMKYDMCGAAAVYGVMKTIAELRLPINVIGVLAGCENMPGKHAYRPGDVLTTMSGKTVEVLNTDAEGRLVLSDVLTYVERFNPEVVIDVATLTGACVIALGHHITGLMSNHDMLAQELIDASKQSSDYAWRLPLINEFQKQLESDFADMVNIGGRSGGAITAGCFLSRFTQKYNWAHLDIAGTAWISSKSKGATGRPVAMLSQFLLNRTGFNCAD